MLKTVRTTIQRQSYKNDPKTKREGDFLWKLMPAELKPSFKRIKTEPGTGKGKRLKTADDIDAKLKALEQKESSGDPADMIKKEKSDSEDEKDVEDQEEEMVDEEMDDENDYGNNYFDNGEAYNDEDDNLDDGPVY
uniref:DNA-directed RNA polymerase III subunit n=1 Tax=Anopheles farauti TaxID=69004 RepID=A0A182QZU3_9DIPT